MENKTTKTADGSVYIPMEKRTGEESVVFFTRDLSPAGLQKIFRRVSQVLEGKICVKVHTGEKNGPNIIPCPWIAELFRKELPGATIIETNTLYEGDRYTTEQHRETLKVNGWTFSPVDILDEDGTVLLPVTGGKWFTEMSIGKNLVNYDSLFTLTHFKGHTNGGFGGSAKNLGIGCADGQVGKHWIHMHPESGGKKWSANGELFMERMIESTKSVLEFFGKKVCYVNVMRNMSVSCDCEGLKAQPVVTPDVGICASLDILAVDQACVDLIYALKPEDRKAMVERIESRGGHRQLSYMKELGMGNDRYTLIDIDHDDAVISPAEAVKDVVPFSRDNKKVRDGEKLISL